MMYFSRANVFFLLCFALVMACGEVQVVAQKVAGKKTSYSSPTTIITSDDTFGSKVPSLKREELAFWKAKGSELYKSVFLFSLMNNTDSLAQEPSAMSINRWHFAYTDPSLLEKGSPFKVVSLDRREGMLGYQLAYSLSGNDRFVRVATSAEIAKGGLGGLWATEPRDLRRPDLKPDGEHRRVQRDVLLRAEEGEMKGWYLDFDVENPRIKHPMPPPKPDPLAQPNKLDEWGYTLWLARLSPKPGPKSKLAWITSTHIISP